MKTFFVDAFTGEPFTGNPAAVCIVENELPELLMQRIASEIGFSETAFIRSISDGAYEIRFFTPKQEIPLCGHATLAASKVVFETRKIKEIRFINIANTVLRVESVAQGSRMSFPVYETQPISVPGAMLNSLGISSVNDAVYNAELRIIMLAINSTTGLQALSPDFSALVKSYEGINGVLVTAPSGNDGFDFHYRYFWPWSGTNEDPVTGGVQTFLTGYWAGKMKKNRLHSFQSSRRTGSMITEIVDNKVDIYGEAVIVLEGAFMLNN